jgi:hypothetical protein
MRPEITCPYCGITYRLWSLDLDELRRPLLTYCDIEQGGCDKPFAVRFEFRIAASSYRIEDWPEGK